MGSKNELLAGADKLSLPRRILVVDDSRTQRMIVRRALETLEIPIEIDEARDGLSGLIRLRDARFDLVLLDINMPRVSGVEMLQALADFNQNAHVVMLSADDDKVTRDECREHGASTFVKKPIEPGELLSAVTTALTTPSSRRAA